MIEQTPETFIGTTPERLWWALTTPGQTRQDRRPRVVA